jgi:hypothetical protein
MCIFPRLSNVELPLETPGHNLKNAQKGAAFSARACVRALHETKQAFLATSFAEGVADSFIARVPAEFPKVKWRIRIDPSRKCVHVNLVKRTNVPGEEEYLFAPYSAFTVLSVAWNAGTDASPHEIELLAAADNREAREDLPLAPWS